MTARRRLFFLLCVLAVSGLTAQAASAKDLSVAVAANFTDPAKEIAAAFEKKTGTHVVMSFGASGDFFAQIEQGAPYQVFLSADETRPRKLEFDGYAVRGSRFTYATGTLVLWSATPGLVDAHGAVLSQGQFQHLAIADPAAAPYGAAAVEAMTKLGLNTALTPKLVKGASIGQAYAFVKTGAAELGFLSLSQVIKDKSGSMWVVPAEDYTPIVQQATLLSAGEDDPDAKAWMEFLKSPEARTIIAAYGYK